MVLLLAWARKNHMSLVLEQTLAKSNLFKEIVWKSEVYEKPKKRFLSYTHIYTCIIPVKKKKCLYDY